MIFLRISIDRYIIKFCLFFYWNDNLYITKVRWNKFKFIMNLSIHFFKGHLIFQSGFYTRLFLFLTIQLSKHGKLKIHK